ncbi:MAG: hypothetical protein NT027_17465, partial [Proteobacteria bacterium]|nr:hypothetical protein [Pseudomonadota bacterium]
TAKVKSGSVYGASVALPVGSLSIPISITIGAGETIATSSTLAEVGYSAGSVGETDSSVSFESDPATELINPMTLSIPLKKKSSLALGDVDISKSENVIVVFQYAKVEGGTKKIYKGVLPKKMLTISKDSIQFQSKYFGTFQVATTVSKIESQIEKLSESKSSQNNASGGASGSSTNNGGSGANSGPDVTAPIVSGLSVVATGSSTTIVNSSIPSFTFTLNESARVKLYSDSSCVTLYADSGATLLSAGSQTLAYSSSISGDGAKNVYAIATDAANNSSACANATLAYTLDTTSPSTTISRVTSDPTNSQTLQYYVAFSESVTGFTSGFFSLTGYSMETPAITQSGNNYYVSASMSSAPAADQTIVATAIVTGVVDLAGNAAGTASPTSLNISYLKTPVLSAVSVEPTEPGLTRKPTLKFTSDAGGDQLRVYTDSGCTSLHETITTSVSVGLNSPSLITALPTIGTHTLYAKVLRSVTESACTSIGSYKTGINKVMVASSSVGDWACAIVNGGVKCWGYNGHGQLGDSTGTTRSAPTSVTGLPEGSGVTDIAMSVDWQTSNHSSTCALANGLVKCWGKNTYGQLAQGDTISKNAPFDVKTSGSPTFLSGVSKIYGSTGRFCALKTDQKLFCWGRNTYGEVGANMTAGSHVYYATAVDSGENYTKISMGNYYNCGLTTSGAVKCWGFNDFGKLGDGTTTDRNVPTATNITSGATDVSADDQTSCAVVGGSPKCWGLNDVGQIGNGTVSNSSTPTVVSGSLSSVSKIIAGRTSYAILGTTLKGWGANLYGQVFDGGFTDQLTPVSPDPGGVFSAGYIITDIGFSTASGGKDVICAVLNGGVTCRGHLLNSSYRGVGDQTGTGYVIGTTLNASMVAASSNLSCAVLDHSSIRCWGKNNHGQLGRGSTSMFELVASQTNPVF